MSATTTIQTKTPTSAEDAAQTGHGFPAGTRIMTLDGELPVEYLCPGDRVITRSGMACVSIIESHILARADVVRVSASALGHDRPEEDMVILASQPVLVRDWRAEALFGAPQAMVPASRLVDGAYITRETMTNQRFYTLEFDTPAVIYAGGMELGCAANRVPA